jgi:hypothetical protein
LFLFFYEFDFIPREGWVKMFPKLYELESLILQALMSGALI